MAGEVTEFAKTSGLRKSRKIPSSPEFFGRLPCPELHYTATASTGHPAFRLSPARSAPGRCRLQSVAQHPGK